MYKRIIALLTISILSLSGCAALTSVSLTQIPQDRSNVVQASVQKTVFLAFNFDNDYVDELVAKLKTKCPNGQVKGILTKDEVFIYFLVFKKVITATGFCVK
jgi:hypothetical protein